VNAFARYDAQGRLVEERPLTIAEAAEKHGLAVRYDPESSSDPGRRWHLVRRLTRSDQHALDWLKRLAVPFYYPRMRELRPVPKRKITPAQRRSGVMLMRPCIVPLFPGYIFVRINLAADDWRRIRDAAGVGGLVTEGNIPVEISDALVASIEAAEVDGVVPGKTPASLIFKPGERVRVKDGPFAAFNAEIERAPDYTIGDVDGETRIKVLVNAFGRPTPVDLAIGQIEKL